MKFFIATLLTTLLSTLLFVSEGNAQRQKIEIAIIDWCPQICPYTPEQPGYIAEITEHLFDNSPYEVKFTVLPWSRALNSTLSGKTVAVLAPAKNEAPDLLFPEMAIGTQSMCFITREDSTWKFDGIDSLEGIKIGIAENTDIGYLANFARENPNQFEYLTYSDQYIKSSLQKVKSKRMHTFLFTLNSAIHGIRQLGWEDDFKVAGCLPSTNVYMAFTPQISQRKKVSELINHLDTKMRKALNEGSIAYIFEKYKIENKLTH